MDGDMAQRQPVRLVNLIDGWRERAAIKDEELRRAAENWGVRREHPEAAFVDTLIASHSEMGELLGAFVGDMEVIVTEQRQAAKDEFARHHSAREESLHQIGVMQSVVRSLDVEKARMASEMLKEAIPLIAKGVREAVTVREVWVARGRTIQQALFVAAAAVCLFVGGYSLRSVQVLGMADAALRNAEGIDACKVATVWRDPDGHRLCRLDAFTASEADAK